MAFQSNLTECTSWESEMSQWYQVPLQWGSKEWYLAIHFINQKTRQSDLSDKNSGPSRFLLVFLSSMIDIKIKLELKPTTHLTHFTRDIYDRK